MVGTEHFRNLEYRYSQSDDAAGGTDAQVTFGRAVLAGTVEPSGEMVQRMPHQNLLNDVATLAAHSLVKQATVSAEEFNAHVEDPDYAGPVHASAAVVLKKPSRIVVNAVLHTPDGQVVAEASGVFRREEAASTETVEAPGTAAQSALPPARFLSAFETPFGLVSLN